MISLIVFSVGIFISSVSAEIYQWVDKNGVSHASDRPPRPADVVGEVETMKTFPATTPSTAVPKNPSRTESLPVRAPAQEHKAQKAELNKDASVELYTTSWCSYCEQARQFFRSRGIPFREYDIEKDRGAATRKRQLDSKGGIPFAVINGKKIHGYSQAAYQQALGK